MQSKNEIQFEAINEQYYSDFLEVCQKNVFAPLLLPPQFSENLWGVVALQDSRVVGGLVGVLRGNKPLVKHFSKGVWFNSYPVFSAEIENLDIIKSLIDFAKIKAKKENVILFNFTHWVRQTEGIDFDIAEKSATFLLDFNKDTESLWKEVDSRQKTVIRKGEKNSVSVEILQKNDALKYLDDFQQLRQTTQSRAVAKNASSSMLLKSNNFFADIFKNLNSTLFVAKHEGKVAAVALMLQSGTTIYYYSGGSDIEMNKQTGASTFLIWKAIEYAKTLNLRYFDMGGVPVMPEKNHPAYGVFSFKKSFGGEYKEYNSGKIIISPTKYKLLNFVLKNRKLLRFLSKNEN